MAFTPRTESEILDQLIAQILAKTELTDVHEGGAELEKLGAIARVVGRTEQDMQKVYDLRDLDKCFGADLDERATEVLPDTLQRQLATYAVGSYKFLRAENDIAGETVIPAGQAVSRDLDGFLYQTTTDAKVEDGQYQSTPVSIVAQKAGTSGNCGVGTVNVLKSPPARIVGGTNTTEIVGGLDQENDDSLRDRVRNRARSLARCNRAAIEQAILFFTNSSGQRVRFLRTEQAPPRANIWIDDGTGQLSSMIVSVEDKPVLIKSAFGNERIVFLPDYAICDPPTMLKRTRYSTEVELKLNRDYTIESPWGLISLKSSLQTGDKLEVSDVYSIYTGLVHDVQRFIDGDPSDRVNSPGYVGVGNCVRIVPALSWTQYIQLSVVFKNGLPQNLLATAKQAVTNNVLALVNTLNVGEPLYVASIIDVVMNLTSYVDNVHVIEPASDVYPPVNTVVRTNSDYVVVK